VFFTRWVALPDLDRRRLPRYSQLRRRHARSAAAALRPQLTPRRTFLSNDELEHPAQMGVAAHYEVDLLVHAQS